MVFTHIHLQEHSFHIHTYSRTLVPHTYIFTNSRSTHRHLHELSFHPHTSSRTLVPLTNIFTNSRSTHKHLHELSFHIHTSSQTLVNRRLFLCQYIPTVFVNECSLVTSERDYPDQYVYLILVTRGTTDLRHVVQQTLDTLNNRP